MSSIGKPNSSESYGDSIDSPDKKTVDSNGVGRSYECSFCKRGFTNAQALGGHMNIHRKDKAKAKKKDFLGNSPKSHHHEDYTTAQKFFTGISSDHHHHHQQQQQQQRHYTSSLGAYMRCQLYFPSPNPSYLHGFDLVGSSMKKDHRSTLYEYRKMDQNLSLRIGSSHSEDHHVGGRENNMIEAHDHVDLELRLGYP